MKLYEGMSDRGPGIDFKSYSKNLMQQSSQKIFENTKFSESMDAAAYSGD